MRVKLYVGDGLGNIVHALPTIQAIQKTGHELTVGVVSSWPDAAGLIDHDKVETEPGNYANPAYDRVFCTAILPRLRLADGSYPYAGYEHPPHSLQETSEVEANFWIARQLGYEGPMPMPKIAGPFESPVEGEYVVIAPGFQKAGGVWANKGYSHWLEVATVLWQVKIVYVGSAADAEPWMDNRKEAWLNLCGKTNLRQLCGVLAKASAVVGPDNGPTALAAALGVKTVVLWGPTSKVKNRKFGRNVVNLSMDSVACRPCQFTGRLATCEDAKCMALIPPSAVVAAIGVTSAPEPSGIPTIAWSDLTDVRDAPQQGSGWSQAYLATWRGEPVFVKVQDLDFSNRRDQELGVLLSGIPNLVKPLAKGSKDGLNFLVLERLEPLTDAEARTPEVARLGLFTARQLWLHELDFWAPALKHIMRRGRELVCVDFNDDHWRGERWLNSEPVQQWRSQVGEKLFLDALSWLIREEYALLQNVHDPCLILPDSLRTETEQGSPNFGKRVPPNRICTDRLAMLREHWPTGAKTVVDVGCDTGWFVTVLTHDGMKCTGIEADPLKCEFAELVSDAAGAPCQFIPMTVTPQNIASMPVSDVTLCFSVLHWMAIKAPDGSSQISFAGGRESAESVLRGLADKTRMTLFLEIPPWAGSELGYGPAHAEMCKWVKHVGGFDSVKVAGVTDANRPMMVCRRNQDDGFVTSHGHLVNTRLLPARPIIVDAGACCGAFVSELGEQFDLSGAMLTCIEPSAENCKTLSSTLPGAKIVSAALARKGRDSVMFVPSPNKPEWGRCELVDAGPVPDTAISVPCVSVAEFLPIDLLKMDIEGLEQEVLDGLTADEANQIGQITLEVHEPYTAEACKSRLQALGFTVKSEGNEVWGGRI